MVQELSIDLIDTVKGISECVDFVNLVFSKHHTKVAYIALKIAQEMNISSEGRRNLVMASLLHDVGALQLRKG